MFVSGLCLSSQPAMVTWRSSSLFPGSYITPTRKPVIVLFAQAGFSKCGWMGGGFNHTVYSLSSKPAVCQATTGPIPCPGPLSVPLPSLGALGQPWHCFDWDLCHLWLLNHVDTRVIHAWRGCLCLDPGTHSYCLAAVLACCADHSFVLSVIFGV